MDNQTQTLAVKRAPDLDTDADELPHGAECILDGNRGIYVPEHFAFLVEATLHGTWSGITKSDLDTLSNGPDTDDEPGYWETWDRVRYSARYTSPEGQGFYLYQDNDLYLVPDAPDEPGTPGTPAQTT